MGRQPRLERVCELTSAVVYGHEQDANLSQRSHGCPVGLDSALVAQTPQTWPTTPPGLPPCSRRHLLPATHRLPVAATAARLPALGHRGRLFLALASQRPVAAHSPHAARCCASTSR